MPNIEVKNIVEKDNLTCKFGKKKLGFIAVYCNFNPANHTAFLDAVGNVQKAGMYDDIIGYFIVKTDNKFTYNEFADKIGESLLSIKI